MSVGDKLPVILLVVLTAGAVYYLGWVGPQRRAATINQFVDEALAAYAARDCVTAADRLAAAERRLGNDSLPERAVEVDETCSALLEAPAGGVRRFLDHVVTLVCAGRPLSLTDDLGRQYGPEFFTLIDTTATGMWGDERIDRFLPDAQRARNVHTFRYALCTRVEESRELERCSYTLYSGATPRTVQLIRADQRWNVRVVDVTRSRTVARRSFWVRNPGSCEENESLLNRGTSVVTGSIDTTRFATWLESIGS